MLLNATRARRFMEQCRLGALVASSPITIRYLTDYACWLDPLFKDWMMRPGAPSELAQHYAVVTRDGRVGLVVAALFGVNAAGLPIDDLRLVGPAGLDEGLAPAEPSPAARPWRRVLDEAVPAATAGEALAGLLRTYGLADGRVGLERDGLPAGQVTALEAALPRAELPDASNLLRLIRAVKSAAELERLTRAAEISERALRASLALARPGRPLADLAQRFRAAVAEAGAAFDHVGFSPYGTGIATEPDYELPEGDVLYLDVGCVYRGYYADTGLTLAGRAPAPSLGERYTALRDCVEAAAARARPGVRASRLQAAMADALTAAGIERCFPHGHGLGLEVRDYPIVVPPTGLPLRDGCIDESSDLELEADMVINLEAPLFMPGVGSLHVERSFVITASGCRALIDQDRAAPVVAGAG